MQVELLLPNPGVVPLEELRARLTEGESSEPFHPPLVDAAVDFSQRVFRDAEAKKYPELMALAYWMRRSELLRLAARFHSLQLEHRLLAPRGLVFHLPPRNVDTMFVYSWLLSALTGNRNIIRLSPRRSDTTNLLLRLFQETLAEADEPARGSTLVVSYGHDDDTTGLLSSVCDIRVIWGGDQTVANIRRVSLPVHARELTFPDRHSLSALQAAAYLELAESDQDQLADKFFNDAYWFDQAGCSSPRLVAWCGEPEQTR